MKNEIWTGKTTLLMFVETKEGWLVRLGQERVVWGWGNCLKYPKRGWNRKDRRANKDFKKKGKLGQGVGALKTGGSGIPLPTMSII